MSILKITYCLFLPKIRGRNFLKNRWMGPGLFIFLSFISLLSAAQSTNHKGISFQALVKLPTGEQPTRSGLTVTLFILSPNNCILREEQFSGVNISNGYINIPIGTGTPAGDDPGLSMKQVMDNSAAITQGPSKPGGLSCFDSNGNFSASVTSYNPATGDGRRKFRLSMMIDSIPVVADFNLRSMAYAISAETADEAKKLNGKSDVDFIQASTQVTQSTVESWFTSTTFNNILNNQYVASSLSPSANLAMTTDIVTSQNLRASKSVTAGSLYLYDTAATPASVGLKAPANIVAAGGASYVLTLPVNKGVTGQLLAAKDDAGTLEWINSNAVSVTLAGDVSSTGFNNGTVSTSVNKIKNVTITGAPTSDGQVFRMQGGQLQPGFVSMLDLRSNVTGALALSASCTANQTLTFNSATDSLKCENISITKDQVSGLGALALKGSVDLSSTEVTGVLPVSKGGTGSTTGSITGTEGLTLSAGGTNQNVTLTPSGTGYTLLNGRVGVGTSSPAALMHVQGGRFRSDSDSDVDPGLAINAYGVGRNPVIVSTAARGTIAEPAAVVAGDQLLRFVVNGNNGSGSIRAGEIAFTAAEDFSSTAGGANLIFANTNIGSNSATEKMRLTSEGKLGVGSIYPEGKVHIRGDSSAAGNIILALQNRNSSPGPDALLAFATGANDLSDNRYSYLGAVSESGNSHSLVFATNSDANSAVERMRISPTGSIGIGTMTPAVGWNGFTPAGVTQMTTLSGGTTAIPSINSWRDTNSAYGAYIQILKSRAGGPVQANDDVGYLRWAGMDSANSYAGFVSIEGKALDATNGTHDGYLTVKVAKNGSMVDNLVLTGGNVGIGTTTPSEDLVVGDDLGALTMSKSIVIGDSNSANQAKLFLGENINNFSWIEHHNMTDQMRFSTKVGGVLYSSTIALDRGNVGIGTTTPTALLDVNGHVANSGAAATIGSCGTSPGISGNDNRGAVSTGTGTVNSCARI